jgi:hypothetical protein
MPEFTPGTNPWEFADHISDCIIDLMNQKLSDPRFNPIQMLAGEMLALVAYLRTAPTPLPTSLQIVRTAVEECLRDLARNAEER